MYERADTRYKELGGVLMTLAEAIDLLVNNYYRVKDCEYIKKPMAWALYQTFKQADKIEKEREVQNDK